MRRFYLLISAVFYVQFCWSNVFQPVENYTIHNGLSHAEVTCLHIDKLGFLWVGTTDGLNRFDGYSFHTYHADPEDTNSIANNNILSLTEDSYGDLFVCTATGISKYNVQTDNFSSVYLQQNEAVNSYMSTIQNIAIDSSHRYLYILTKNYLVRKSLKDNSQKKIAWSNSRQAAFRFLTLINGSDNIILGSLKHLYLYLVNKDTIIPFFSALDTPISEDGGIKGAISVSKNVVILYSTNRIWKYEVKQNTIFPVDLVSNMSSPAKIISLRRSTGKILDILTEKGLIEYDIDHDRILGTANLDYFSKPGFLISSFIRDKNNVLWIGSNRGLLKFNLYKRVFKNFHLSDLNYQGQHITSVTFDKNEMLWLGLNSGELLIIDPNIPARDNPIIAHHHFEKKLNALSRNANNDILLSTSHGLYLYTINPKKDYKQDLLLHKIYLADKDIYTASADELFTSLIATNDGIYELTYENNRIVKLPKLTDLTFGEPVLGIRISPEYTWIVQTYRIVQLTKTRDQHHLIYFSKTGRGDMPLIKSTYPDGLYDLIIGTSGGMYRYNARNEKINLFDSSHFGMNYSIHAITKDLRGRYWFSTNDGLSAFDNTTGQLKEFDYNDGMDVRLFADRLIARAPNGEIAFCGKQSVSIFEPDSLFKKGHSPKVLMTEGELYRKGKQETINLVDRDTVKIGPEYRYFKVNFSTMDFWAPKRNSYRYSLEKSNKPLQWINLNDQNYLILSNLSAGYYKLSILGANSNGDWSRNRAELVLHVIAPIWQRPIAYALYVILGILILYFTVVIRTKHLLKLNREYREREIISKKIELQKEELALKNKNITDSLNYARRIQMALMPSQRVFRKYFPDSFILHMPKDIVSGDFYWINEVNDRVFFAAVDCTGHGVPGAFMSIIGFELLRRITEIDKKRQPADILNNLSRGFETIFRDVENITLRDGMDMAFCAVDKDKKALEFAGAFNPLYLVRDNTITEVKGDRFSVGLQNDDSEEVSVFTNHILPLRKGDILYIFTDGLADQFGGPEGKKYKYRRFRHLLLAIHQLAMDQQVEFLRRSIIDWKGNLDQVDDILVMGIRIS